MKKPIVIGAMAAISFLALPSCNQGAGNGGSAEIENTDLVPSGTYTGTATEVDAEEKEIYVETEDGKTLELYFTDQTELTQNGESVAFDALSEGAQVEITVEKKGKRLEPVSVKIME